MKSMGNGLLSLCERLAAKAPDLPEGAVPFPPTPEEIWINTLASAKVPQRYRSIPMDLPLNRDVKGWRGSPEFITFLGAVGTGKTWQATKLFGDFCVESRARYEETLAGSGAVYCKSSLWIDAAEAVESIRREIASDHDGKTMGQLCGVGLLMLDDLLAERDTEFTRDKLGFVLRHRHAHMLPTIITSNSGDKDGAPSLEAIGKIDPRLASRIAEGLIIKIGGRDRRLR